MRVVVAEDHTLVRMGLRLLLESIPEVQVVGDAADGDQALQLIEETHPDCVLMDLSMPGLNGLEATRRASARFPETRILVLSMHAEEAYVQQALAAGAAGYLLKGAEKDELALALRIVAQSMRSSGAPFFGSFRIARKPCPALPRSSNPLTTRSSARRSTGRSRAGTGGRSDSMAIARARRSAGRCRSLCRPTASTSWKRSSKD